MSNFLMLLCSALRFLGLWFVLSYMTISGSLCGQLSWQKKMKKLYLLV